MPTKQKEANEKLGEARLECPPGCLVCEDIVREFVEGLE
jgi:hypothetical protein